MTINKFFPILFLFICLMIAAINVPAQSESQLTALEIIDKANSKLNSTDSYAELTMTIIRPTWKREVQMRSWSQGEDLAVIQITAPARDQGVAFLKNGQDMYNWQPKIERSIKMPPSMMSQSWMGSDFTNDDLVKQSSILTDYSHQLIGNERVAELNCYRIELIPKPESAVVWGKLHVWIDVEHFMQLKVQFFDEDDELVSTLSGTDFKLLDGEMLPSTLTVEPADEEGHKTQITYNALSFKIDVPDDFFTVKQLRRLN